MEPSQQPHPRRSNAGARGHQYTSLAGGHRARLRRLPLPPLRCAHLLDGVKVIRLALDRSFGRASAKVSVLIVVLESSHRALIASTVSSNCTRALPSAGQGPARLEAFRRVTEGTLHAHELTCISGDECSLWVCAFH